MATKDQRWSLPSDRKRRPRKTLRRLVVLLLLLAAAVSFAPAMVAKTSLRNTLLGWAWSAEGWRIESQEASFSWTGEQTLSGVSIVDVEGKSFFTAETISLGRSLFAMAANQNDLGKIKIVRPTAYLVTRPEGSNVEDFLAAIRASSSPMDEEKSPLVLSSSKASVDVSVEIIDGTVRGFEEPTGRQWLLDQANFVVALGSATPGGIALEGKLNLRSGQNGTPGRIQVRLQQIAENQSQLDLLAEDFPLTPLEPWLMRNLPGIELAGTASSTAQVRWTRDPVRGLLVQTSGQFEANQLDMTANALAGDRLRCQRLTVPWELNFADEVLTIGQLSADAGWARLQASGSATLEELTSFRLTNLPKQETRVAGSVQLEKLAAMLPRTLQLREGVRIDSGELKFQAAGRPSANGFFWSATATLQGVAGVDGGRAIRWEKPIEAQVELVDTAQGPQMQRFLLNAPFVEADFQTASEQVTGSFQFDLGLLSEELGQLVDLDAWQFRGTGTGTLSLTRKSGAPLEGSAEVDLSDLQIRNAGVVLEESRVQFAGDCRWDPAAKRLVSREMQLVSSTLAFRSRDVSFELGDSSATTATGDIAFNVDLERLASALGIVGQEESTWPRGAMLGNLRLSSNAQQIRADLSTTTKQLQIVRTGLANGAVDGRPEVLWAEPELTATTQATYSLAEDRLELKNLQLNGQTARLKGSLAIDKLGAAGDLRAQGIMEYNEGAFAQLLASYLGPEVRLQGARQVRFEVAGPLASAPTHWSRRWTMTADAGWSAAAVYGLPLSAGRVQGTLRDGQLQFAPIEIGVGQGQLTANLRAILDPSPQYLVLPKGPLVSRVQISPQVSETMLKYVAPILAGATRAEGEFSVELDDTQIPLATPEQSRVVGRLAIHRLSVAPGPMVAELITLIEQIDMLTKGKQFLQAAASPSRNKGLTIDNRKIDFQIVGGRVYHRNLEFIVDNVPVRSRGSVGFDQTLALEVEIPIQDKWIERQRVLQSLAGQTLKIPIQGTLQKPRIDQRAVTDLSRQMLQGVATEAIGGEINRALEKLFKPR